MLGRKTLPYRRSSRSVVRSVKRTYSRCYRTRRVEQNSENEFEEKETVDRVERWQGMKAEERE